MNVAIIVLAFAVVLFVISFFTKRRFGALGLGLAAGAMLSQLWANDFVEIIEGAGVELVAPPLESVVSAFLIIAPAALLLLRGSTYSDKMKRIIGSAVFALMAVAFLLQPLGGAIVLTGSGRQVYDVLVENRSLIITGGILYALFDILTARSPKKDKEKH